MGGPAVQVRQRLTPEQRTTLARRRKGGESVAALAEAYGITPRSVQRTVRRQDATTVAKAEPAVPFAFRAPATEVEAFDAVAREAGLGRRGSAFRALMRMAAGLVDVPGDHLDRLHEATVRVSRLGVNLNQLTRSVHRGKLRLGDEDRALLRGLAREVEGLRREWGRGARDRGAAALLRRGGSWPARRRGRGPGRALVGSPRMADALALYRAVMGQVWEDELPRVRAQREAGAARQGRGRGRRPVPGRSRGWSDGPWGRPSARDLMRAAAGGQAAVFKRIRAGGCKSPRALRDQLSYVNDKAVFVTSTLVPEPQDGVVLSPSEKMEIVDALH